VAVHQLSDVGQLYVCINESLFELVVLGLVEVEGQPVDFAVVGVELVELDGLGVVHIDGVKDRPDILFCEAGV